MLCHGWSFDIFFVVVVLNLSGCYSAFPSWWHNYVSSSIQTHSQTPFVPVVIVAPIPPPVKYLKTNQYVLPDVIIWDPHQQFPKEFGQALNCFEDDCHQSLKLLRWQDGYKEWHKPRSIHGINGEVLIVAQILYCSNGHQITTCDASILLMTNCVFRLYCCINVG